MDYAGGGEFAWFRQEVLRSLVRPRTFARELVREHWGLEGVLVALFGGFALSIAVDALVVLTKGISPLGFVARIVIDAFLLGVRLDVTAAILAVVLFGTLRLLRRPLTLDQAFTAIAFAFGPLIVSPLAVIFVVFGPDLAIVAGVILAAIAIRVLVGLALNFAAILPLPIVAVAILVVLVSGDLVMSDQVSRLRMTAYTVAPALAQPLQAAPAEGKRYDMEGGSSLVVPSEWAYSIRGIAGEVAHFETATATLNVVRGTAEPLSTMDRFADDLARGERFGFHATRSDRAVVRIGKELAVDDLADGTYEGRHIALRQFTIERGFSGIALQFRFFDPPDANASFAEAAAIAATLTIRR